MSDTQRTGYAPKVPRFDQHVQAWRAAKIEEFWWQAVIEDRAESALPPANLWTPDRD